MTMTASTAASCLRADQRMGGVLSAQEQDALLLRIRRSRAYEIAYKVVSEPMVYLGRNTTDHELADLQALMATPERQRQKRIGIWQYGRSSTFAP